MLLWLDVDMVVHRREGGQLDCVLVDLAKFQVSDHAYNYPRNDDYQQFRQTLATALDISQEDVTERWRSIGLRECWDVFAG